MIATSYLATQVESEELDKVAHPIKDPGSESGRAT